MDIIFFISLVLPHGITFLIRFKKYALAHSLVVTIDSFTTILLNFTYTHVERCEFFFLYAKRDEREICAAPPTECI